MNENKVNAETATNNTATNSVAEAAKTAEATAEQVAFVECESDKDSAEAKVFRRVLHDENFVRADATDTKPTNPLRRGEVVVAEECMGSLKDFRKELMDGNILAPDKIQKVSFRVEGFVQRDGSTANTSVLAAKQFVVTLKIDGRWVTLPRWLATVDGGLYALGATQTARAAKELATILHMIWVCGRKPDDVKEIVKGWHKKPTAKK